MFVYEHSWTTKRGYCQFLADGIKFGQKTGMKSVKKFLRNKKNHILLLGVAVSFFLVFHQKHSPALSLVSENAATKTLPSGESGSTRGNLLSANFLAAFISSITSASSTEDSNQTCRKNFSVEKPPVIDVFSTSK